jgi:hypothetical protein
MLQPKKKIESAFDKAFTQEVAGQTQEDFVSKASGATAVTSKSQLETANQSLAGNREKMLSAFTQSNVQNNEKLKEVQAARKEYLSKPQNHVEEEHQKTLNNLDKFVKFKEKVLTLSDKQDRAAILQKKSESLDFFDDNSINIFSPFYKLHDLIADDKNKWGITTDEENELDGLNTTIAKAEAELTKEVTPTVAKINSQQKLAQAEHKAELTRLTGIVKESRKGEDQEMKKQSFGDLMSKIYSSDMLKSIGSSFGEAKEAVFGEGLSDNIGEMDQIAILNSTMRKNKDLIKYTQDFLDGKNNVWDPLLNVDKGANLGTLGIYGMTEELAYKTPVMNKYNRLINELGDEKAAFAKMSYAEQQLIKTNAIHEDLRQNKATANMFVKEGAVDWYRHADGTADSIVFMEQMFFTSPVSGLVGGALKASARNVITKGLINNTVRGSLKRKLGAFALTKTTQLTGAVVSAPVSPSTWTQAMKEHNGGIQIIEDEGGEKRYLVRDSLFKNYKRDYNYKKSLINKQKEAIQSKTELTEEDRLELKVLADREGELEQEFDSLRPKSWFESMAYGTWETAKENFIETAGGDFGQKLFGKLGKAIGKSETGKFITNPKFLTTKAAKGVSELYKKGGEAFENNILGKISGKAMYRTGSNRIVHGLPEEMFEEVLSQITPSVNRDYTEQLNQLKDPSFYVDVLAQTAMMGGMFTGLGGVSTVANWKANGRIYDAKKNIIKKYRAIDKAVTDEDLANTIVMSSAGTNYSIADYDAKIQELRDAKQNKAADELEQKKFVNMATVAMQTNTLDQFERTLDNLLKNSQNSLGLGGISAETIQNVQLAKEKIEKIKQTHKQYQGRSNIGTIIDLATKKLATQQGLQNIQTEISTQRILANEELQTLKDKAPDSLQNTDIDTLLNNEELSPEDAETTFEFVRKVDEAKSPAIQSYIRLLETQAEMRFSQKETMKTFNEETSPTREAEILKKKGIKRAINKQFRDTVEFAETNGVSIPGLEIDATGKAQVGKDFIEHSFKNVLDTYGLDKKELDSIKQEYLDRVEQQESIKRMKADNSIMSLYDQAQIVIQEQKQKAQDKKQAEEDAINNPEDGTQFRLFEEEESEMASEEEVAAYEENIENAREILLSHPAVLDNENYDKNYVEKVEASLPKMVELSAQGQGLTRADIKASFPIFTDAQAEALAFALNNTVVLPGQKESVEELPINSLETVAEITQQAQADIEKILTPDDVEEMPDSLIVDEEDTLSTFQLMPSEISGEKFSEQEIKGLKGVVNNYYSALKKELGREPSFKELMHHFIKFTSKEQAQKFFPAYRVGWEANNFAATNYDDVYMEIFQPGKDAAEAANSFLENLYSTRNSFTETPATLTQNTEQQAKQIASNQTTITNFTESNLPVKNENENRITSPSLRLGFNAVKYEEVEILDYQGIGTGTFIRQTVLTDSLNQENPLIDYKDLLNPDMYNPGDSINVGMAPENMWSTIMINVGRDSENKPILKSFAEIVAEKEKENPDFKNTEEFVDSVPMFAYNNKGEALAYIHESSWYNEWNVSDPLNADGVVNPRAITLAHKQAIDEAKSVASNFRKVIHSGQVSQITIKEKKEGPYYSIANKINPETGEKVKLYTLAEASPESHIMIQGKQNVLEHGVGKPFENGKRVIVNKEQIAQKKQGYTWELRRIGVDAQGRETYRAFGVVRYPKIEELETVRWAWAAYSFFDHKETLQGAVKTKVIQEVRKKFLPEQYQITEEKAKEIVKDIKAITGYDLKSFEDAMAFFNLFIQPKSGNTPAEFGRTLYNLDEKAFSQHTLRDGLDINPTIPMIKDGKVVSTNMKYSDYLKTTLQTEVKSFNVGTAEKPVYATSIQPKIVFEYETGIPEQNPVTEIAEKKIQAQEVKQELNQITDVTEVLKKAQDLLSDLGFNNMNVQAMPVEMNGVEHLRNILNLTPGLSIDQESQLLNFTVQYINTLIDTKFKGKANKALLMKELKTSFDTIVGPSYTEVSATKQRLQDLNAISPSDELSSTIESYDKVLRIFDNLQKNWDTEAIKKVLAISGMPYTGQIGLIEKAIQEVGETSDIKEGKESDIDEEDSEGQLEDDVSLSEKSFDDAASLTENFKTKTTLRQKRFMSGVTKVDKAGEAVKGFLGLSQFMNYNEVYDAIYSLLGSGVYIESDYETMKAKLLTMAVAHPWVTELVDKYDKADAQLRKGLVLNYRKHAISMKFLMYDSRGKDSNLKVYDTNANEITRVIRTEWANNFITSPLVILDNGQYSINKDTAIKLRDQFLSWGTEGQLQNDQVVRDWLGAFGIELSDEYWEELKEVGMMSKGQYIPYNQLFSSPNTPIGYLGIYLDRIVNTNDVKHISNLKFEENPKAHPFDDMQGVLKDLSKGESKFTTKVMSKSFRDAQKSVTGITNPTYITNKVDDLIRSAMSEDKTAIKELQDLSISSNSTMLHLLMTYPDFARKLELNHLGLTALKQYGKKASGFSGITDLNSIDHDLTKLGFFQDQQQGDIPSRIKVGGFKMRMARMFVPTMSDKSQMYTMSTAVFDFMKQSNSAFETNSEGELIFTEDLRQLLYDKLILPEMKRISKFHRSVKQTQVKDYDNAAQIFNFIPALNNVKDKDGYRIIEHLSKKSVEDIEALYKEDLINVVEDVMHSIAQQKVEQFESFVERNAEGKVTKVNFLDNAYMNSNPANITMDERLQHATYDFVLNSVLSNADTFVTIAGDPAFFSQDKNFEKNTPPYAMSSDAAYIKLAKKQGVNIGKRLAYLSAPGTTLADSKDAKYKQIFLKDSKDISQNIKYLISLYEGKERLKEKFMDSTVSEAIDKYSTLTPASKAVVREGLEKLFPTIGDYFSIDTTDAQEYTTVKEHIGILYNQERLSEADFIKINNKVDKGEELSYEDIGLILQPLKPVYTGQIMDSDKDMSRPVYIKSSSFPLIKELTAGLEIDNLRVALENLEKPTEQGGYGMPVRASYQSANKVGAMIDSNTIDPLNPESLKSIETAMVELNRNDFRIQQDVPFKSNKKKEDKIAMGTQIFKLLFGDGMLDQFGFVLPGVNEGKPMKGSALYDIYNDTFQKLVESKKQQLYTELGLDEGGTPIDEAVTIQKVQTLLQKEALDRNYPLKDIKGLELKTLYDTQGNPYYEFNVPLWLSTNSNRYESLLNAIVNNRLIAHKIPGNSFVAASEHGFGFKEGLEGIDKSRIIFMDNWDGKELQGVLHEEADENGVRQFKKAQVFVPSKFKDTNGKLIDLFSKDEEGVSIYIEKRENGTWRLKDGVIDPELLSSFSFRTPTSSHVSASTIEIAGILPTEVGDLMIVPKNFTKQKGLDFDVDKENTYQLNHITDYKTGKVEVFSEKHRDRALTKLQNVLDVLELERKKLQRKLLPEEAAALLGMYGDKQKEEDRIDLAQYFGADMLEEVLNEENSTQEKYNALETKMNQKLLENTFIRIHSSIFNNPSPEVQSKINKVLSMKFAQEQADLIEELLEESTSKDIENELVSSGATDIQAKGLAAKATNNFTILSDQYQKEKMGLGSAGKMAIGVYSNYVTLHALIQQTRKQITLTDYLDPDTKKPVAKEINIGGIISKGVLGLITTLDNGRSIAEAFAEKQNTATDNEKEQILGRVNVNSATIGVDSLLSLLGYDKTTYTDSNNEIKNLSVSYGILSQPIIREFVDLLQKSKGVTAEYNANAEEEIAAQLYEKYAPEGLDFGDITSSVLTGDNLVEGIRSQGERKDVQTAALKLFLDLDAYAKNMAKVQATVGLRQLGKSIVEANLKYDELENLGNNTMFNNITSLVGNYIPIKEGTSKPDGYQVVGKFYVKPTTPQGSIVVSALKTNKILWSDFFPHEDPYLKMAMGSIFSISGIPTDSKFKQIEAYQDVFDEVRKYINSWNKFGLYNGTATTERQRLFIDTPKNMSLANYLSSNSREDAIFTNKLLNRLMYDVQTDGKPSLIKFNNTISDDLNEKYLYNTMAEMIVTDRPLPDFNGQPYSTKMLAQDLITYSYIEGGVQEATQFIKYVPLEYLEEVGVKEDGKFVSAANLMQRLNTKRNPQLFKHLLGDVQSLQGKSLFVKQYFQHNPEKTPKLDTKGIDLKADAFFKPGEAFYPSFYHTRVTTKSKLKQDKYTLYQHLGAGEYRKISILGTTGMNEYQAGNTNVNSVIAKQKFEEKKPSALGEKGPATPLETISIANNSKASDVLANIANSSSAKLSRYKAIAQALLPFVSSDLMITIGDSAKTLGVPVNGFYNSNNNTLFIDPVTSASREGKEIGVFMHEIVHAITVKELKKYYSQDANGAFTILSENAPAHVVELHKVWQEVIKTIDPNLIKETQDKVNKLHAKEAVTFTSDELNIGYAATDIFEFMAMAMESRKLQEHMSNQPYNENQSLLDKFISVIKDIIKSINPNIKEGTLAEASLSKVLDFLQEEKAMSAENAIFASLDVDISQEEIEIFDDEDFNTQGFKDDIDLSEDSTGEPEENLMPTEELDELPCNGGLAL